MCYDQQVKRKDKVFKSADIGFWETDLETQLMDLGRQGQWRYIGSIRCLVFIPRRHCKEKGGKAWGQVLNQDQ